MMEPKIKNVFFDFDGTLADTYDIIETFLIEQSSSKHPVPEAHGGIGRGVGMSAMAARLGIPKWRWVNLFFSGRRYLYGRVEYIKPFEGFEEIIKDLHRQHRKLFIVSSNSRGSLAGFLNHRELDKYFVQYTSAIGARLKARQINKLIKRYGLGKAESVYVGDQVRDVAAARLAGVRMIAVTWGFCDKKTLELASPDYVVDTMEELKNLLA